MDHYIRSIDLPLDYSFFLFGPRQVGKSTILNYRFAEDATLIFDLLDLNEIRRLERDPGIFFRTIEARDCERIKYVIVDEVQKLPWILDEVHRVMESSNNPPYFILTGSSARKLKKNQANLLAGRAIEKQLFPFIYEELKNNESKVFNLDEVLQYGTLPKVYLASSNDLKYEILRAYTNIYMKEEIKEESLVRNLGAFNQFLLLAAEENGNTLNYSNIAQDIGVDMKTIKEYYQILIDTLMGFLLMPIKNSVRQQISKTPRFYFFDNGVQRALCEKLKSPILKATKEFGRVFEHWLIKEIIYKANYHRRDYKFSFYRVKEEIEVDLIIEKPSGEILAIEIKANDNPKQEKLKGLKSFAKIFPEARLICASLAPKTYKTDNGIEVLPWQDLLDEL